MDGHQQNVFPSYKPHLFMAAEWRLCVQAIGSIQSLLSLSISLYQYSPHGRRYLPTSTQHILDQMMLQQDPHKSFSHESTSIVHLHNTIIKVVKIAHNTLLERGTYIRSRVWNVVIPHKLKFPGISDYTLSTTISKTDKVGHFSSIGNSNAIQLEIWTSVKF